MNRKIHILFFILLNVLITPAEILFGQITLDHKVFLKEIENSSNIIYGECLEKYNTYLRDHPDDILVQIEKCKFIQLAQYDEDMEFNPNQEEYDSCFTALINKYPVNSEVILYQIENSWGDELKEIFRTTELLIKEKPEDWSESNLGTLYLKISDQFYSDSEYENAYSYIQKSIAHDEKVKSSLLYANILKGLDRSEEALEVLISHRDTTGETWPLVQKANLLFELKAYQEAIEMFNLIFEIDSSYNNNYELAKSLEGIGKYDLSRKYYLRDTAQNWSKETALKNLLNHDLKYQSGDICIETYNKYRSIGYKVDPLSLYRLKLLVNNPSQPWKIRDLAGLLTLIGVIILLIFIPSIWILPVYFIGNYWNLTNQKKTSKSHWGLKWFWIVSFGYLFAALIVGIFYPDYLYSQFSFSYYDSDLNQQDLGRVTLISILVFGATGLVALYKKDLKILLSEKWSIKKSVLLGFGIILAFKLISLIYLRIGTLGLGMSLDELTTIPNILFSSKQEIEALVVNYGKVISFILICLFVPLYEEVIFRGIILDSCQEYLNFKTANIIQATLFGIIHLNLFLFPVFFMFGIMTGLMKKQSQGLLPGIVSHSVNNTLSIALLLLR